MSCYHPFIGYWDGMYTLEGKKRLTIRKLEKGQYEGYKEMHPDAILVPCGHCIGCRLDYSRKWADRMMLELETQKKAIFLTLTYDCRHVPDMEGKVLCDCEFPDVSETKNCPKHEICAQRCKVSGSLCLRHFQLFMKSLRKEMDKQDIKLRFYACGEYGSWKNTHRPHYHCILYGIGLGDLQDKKPAGFNELKQTVYTSDTIARFWPHGNICIADVSWSTCAYVARYTAKKATSPEEELINEMCGINPIFSVMSRKPGIGREYFEQHPDCLDYQNISISTPEGGKKLSIPKYYVNCLKLTDEEKYDKLVKTRQELAEDSVMMKLMQTDLDLVSQLEVEEKQKLKSNKALKRYL